MSPFVGRFRVWMYAAGSCEAAGREATGDSEAEQQGAIIMTEQQGVSRRAVMKGAAGLAGLTVLKVAGPAHAFPGTSDRDEPIPWADDEAGSLRALQDSAGQALPWLDQPAANPFPAVLNNLLTWEELDSWHTPNNEFFYVSHFGVPDGLDESNWRGWTSRSNAPAIPARAWTS
jgi:hypothetical protein